MYRIVITLLCVLLSAPMVSSAAHIKDLVFFGDSLSDNSNIYRLTKRIHHMVPAVPIIPSTPYYKGRFSNGLVWNEHFARLVGFDPKGRHFHDYAYGGAWATGLFEGGKVFPPSLSLQVSQYLLGHTFYDKSETLFMVMIGSNDFLTKDRYAKLHAYQVSQRLEIELRRLVLAGAKHFVISLLPDLSVTPRAALEHRKHSLHAASQYANRAIRVSIARMQAEFGSDITLHVFDTEHALNDVVAHPSAYGFKNVTESCLARPAQQQIINRAVMVPAELLVGLVNQPGKTINLASNVSVATAIQFSEAYHRTSLRKKICANPSEYVFWDDLHPTTSAHAAIAKTYCLSLKKDRAGLLFWNQEAQAFLQPSCIGG